MSFKLCTAWEGGGWVCLGKGPTISCDAGALLQLAIMDFKNLLESVSILKQEGNRCSGQVSV